MSLGRLLSSGKSLIGLSSASRYQFRTGSLPKFESQKNPFAKPSAEQADTRGLSPAEMAASHLKKTQLLPLLPPTPEAPGESFQPPKPSEIRAKPPISTPQETKPSIPSPALNRLAASNPAVAGEDGSANVNDPAATSTSSAGTASPSSLRSGGEGRGEEAFRAQGEKSQPPVQVTNWLKKLNPLVWFGDRKPAEPKSPVPRFNKKPVQGELSLENIKVMRNDLSDADVEVVPKKVLPMQDIPLPGGPAAAAAIPELPPATSAWEYLGERLLRNH